MTIRLVPVNTDFIGIEGIAKTVFESFGIETVVEPTLKVSRRKNPELFLDMGAWNFLADFGFSPDILPYVRDRVDGTLLVVTDEYLSQNPMPGYLVAFDLLAGYAESNIDVSILSTSRMRKNSMAMARILAVHEIGHLFHAADNADDVHCYSMAGDKHCVMAAELYVKQRHFIGPRPGHRLSEYWGYEFCHDCSERVEQNKLQRVS